MPFWRLTVSRLFLEIGWSWRRILDTLQIGRDSLRVINNEYIYFISTSEFRNLQHWRSGGYTAAQLTSITLWKDLVESIDKVGGLHIRYQSGRGCRCKIQTFNTSTVAEHRLDGIDKRLPWNHSGSVFNFNLWDRSVVCNGLIIANRDGIRYVVDATELRH